jgi:hypothetical protein
MSRRMLPVAMVVLSSLASRAATAQTISAYSLPSHPGTPAPLGVSWSMPVSGVTRHAPSWNATDIGLAGGFLAMLWVDAAQTRSLARQGWVGFYESNPILGAQPSVGAINTYTAAVAITTLGVAALLPPRARRWWLAGAFAVETATVIYSTTQVGVAFRVR